MIKSPQELRALTTDLTMSTWTLAAIGALFESGLVDQLKEPKTVDELAAACRSLARSRLERCLDVASAAGVVVADGGRYRLADGMMPFAQPPMRTSLHGDIRSQLMQSVEFLKSSGAGEARGGWTHTDEAILQAQGDASAAMPLMLMGQVLPAIGGDLAARLGQKGARFLDVGVGVGQLAITACRMWPEMNIVGLDVFDAPLALARQNVARANLGNRIELRKQSVEDLRDESVYDFAWLPAFFIPVAAMSNAFTRVRASLKEGGWVLVGTFGGGDDRQRAVNALILDLWGGVMSNADIEALLSAVGFSTVRKLPMPPGAPVLFAAQR
jgi:2-polyprenyl-3-methyl-5-hydroxy-6-metoxy-1,4-benzoquinol methylase